MMKNIDKFAARQTRPILANTRNRHLKNVNSKNGTTQIGNKCEKA